MGRAISHARTMVQGGQGLFKGSNIKKKSAGKARKEKNAGPKVGARKNAKKSKLFKAGYWGDKESMATTKAINQKNEDTLQGAAVKRGAPFAIVKPKGLVQNDKKGGKTGITQQLKKLKQ